MLCDNQKSQQPYNSTSCFVLNLTIAWV